MSERYRNMWQWEGRWEACPGGEIAGAIQDARSIASDQDSPLAFEFNGVSLTIAKDSDPDLIYRDWHRAMQGFIGKSVGPYPASELTPEEVASDDRIKAENDAKAAARQAEYEAKHRGKEASLRSRLETLGPMELSDRAGWKTYVNANTDPYGNGVVVFAERWARLMQTEMALGKPLHECAEETSSEADIDGITGFMYGCAVGVLAKVWKHGEELRRWHNLKHQIKMEGEKANDNGGVLNPAVLVLQGDETG
jgi:hypothetical protein